MPRRVKKHVWQYLWITARRHNGSHLIASTIKLVESTLWNKIRLKSTIKFIFCNPVAAFTDQYSLVGQSVHSLV